MAINLPYPIYGKVYDTSGALIGAGTLIKARNNTTGELISEYTNADSEYALDAGNFSSGYDNNNKVTVYVFSQNAYVESTLTISENKHHFDLTLVTVTDSTLINYTNVQYVWDELDSLGETDISAIRIVRAIQRAESEIDERSGKKWSSTTVTQEIYDFNQYQTSFSPEQLASIENVGRSDYWNAQHADRLWLRNRPVISITTLQRNAAGASSTDSWETLTEQTGSGGDFVLTEDGKAAGYVDFVQNKPVYGKRKARITYLHGYSTTPKNIERLATLMTVKSIVLSKISRSFFDSSHGISLRGIMVDRSAAFAQYLDKISKEIDDIWISIGFNMRAV